MALRVAAYVILGIFARCGGRIARRGYRFHLSLFSAHPTCLPLAAESSAPRFISTSSRRCPSPLLYTAQRLRLNDTICALAAGLGDTIIASTPLLADSFKSRERDRALDSLKFFLLVLLTSSRDYARQTPRCIPQTYFADEARSSLGRPRSDKFIKGPAGRAIEALPP